jgi:gliding motility-associated lipoprotein GldH
MVFDQNQTIPDRIWDKDNVLKFEVPLTDTSLAYNIDINLRNTGAYPMSNLYLFVTTTAPSGLSRRDTVELILADKRGQWYGKGFGNIWQHQRPFRRNIRFPVPGTYTFELQQAMRIDQLPGVVDAGIRIEKYNP